MTLQDKATRSLTVLSLALVFLAGCQEPLHRSVVRVKEACGEVDPACRKAASDGDALAEATRVLTRIKGLCDGLDTGSAICLLKLQDLSGVIGQVGTVAGAWESVSPYPYKAKKIGKLQVGTLSTQYWIGAKDNKGGLYVSQNNRNVVCGAASLIPEGVELETLVTVPGGKAGETKEDLACERLYPDTPLCLGTYVSMCVSSGWWEADHWAMNTKADEACIRTFKWRTADPELLKTVRSELQRYITTVGADLDTCSLRPAKKNKARMRLECGSRGPVFADDMRRK